LAKTNSKWVKQFADSHTLMPLSRREAFKHM
jgi:3-methyladenine DNA glycosylase AlkD